MDVAFEVAESIAVLHFGRLVAHGAKEAVRADPTVQEIYLGTDGAGGSRGSP
jgi:branched-chain amino acid transport system ATP-binding protein